MKPNVGPVRWAIDLSIVLNAAMGQDRFPVDIAALALDYSRTRFPDDPVLRVAGDDLPGFDGALVRSKSGRRGWGVLYNSAFTSRGRINFTLAHELGHYLLHRTHYPQGFTCSSNDLVRWDSEYGQVEHQANVFAANILMPLDDFRRQIPPQARGDLDMISGCAERYRVSLIAAALRWIGYTTRRAVLVCSRDGYILWARSSDAALKSGAFFRTSAGPIEIPGASLAARGAASRDVKAGLTHAPGVWLREGVHEMTITSEQYDFAISLLLLEDEVRLQLENPDDPDLLDIVTNRSRAGES